MALRDQIKKIDQGYDKAMAQNSDLMSQNQTLINENKGASRDSLLQQARLIKKKMEAGLELTDEDMNVLRRVKAQMQGATEAGSVASISEPPTAKGKPILDYDKYDKAFSKAYGQIRPIAEVDLGDGTTPLTRLIDKIYSPLGKYAARKNGEIVIVDENTGEEQVLPVSDFGEAAKRFGISAGGQLAGALPGGKVAGALGKIVGSGAGTGATEVLNARNAVKAAEKFGLVSPEDKILSKVATNKALGGFATGAIGQGLGEAIGAIPGAMKSTGKFLERFGTRGPAEEEAKAAIRESGLTKQIREKFTGDKRFLVGEKVQAATLKKVAEINEQANKYFNTIRKIVTGNKGTNKTIQQADFTNYWQELTDKLSEYGDEGNAVLRRLGNSFGFKDLANNSPSNTSKTGLDIITGEAPRVATGQIDLATGQPITEMVSLRASSNNKIPGRLASGGTVDLITGKPNIYQVNAERFLNGYNSIMKELADVQEKNPGIFRILVQAKKSLNTALGGVSKGLGDSIDDTVSNDLAKGFDSFDAIPKLPEKNSLFSLIRRGMDLKARGFKEIPDDFRKQVIGKNINAPLDPEVVTKNILDSSKFLQKDASIANRLVSNQFGKGALKDMAEGTAAYRVNQVTGNSDFSGNLLANPSNDLLKQASIATPAEQKLAQEAGENLDFTPEYKMAKEATRAGSEAPQTIRAGSIIDVKADKNFDKELLGSEYDTAFQPFQDLLKVQQERGLPTSGRNFVQNLKETFKGNNVISNILGALESDAGKLGVGGGAAGTAIGSVLGGPVGAVTGGSIGSTLGALTGSGLRPAARAASRVISDIPVDKAIEFSSSRVAKILGQTGATAGTALLENPDLLDPAQEKIRRLLGGVNYTEKR